MKNKKKKENWACRGTSSPKEDSPLIMPNL
jgi:hypothetical protein